MKTGKNYRVFAITYATKEYYKAANLNIKSARIKGKADVTLLYSPKDIAPEFYGKNKQILAANIGGGYYLWKPYIICHAMKLLNKGDYLCYSDSGGMYYIGAIEKLINKMSLMKTDIFCLNQPEYAEYEYTKRDAFILLDCDQNKYILEPQRAATAMVIKKTDVTIKLINDWLKYGQDKRIISDIQNTCGEDNYKGFIEHRYDQSIYSLLCKKYNIPFYNWDLTRWQRNIENVWYYHHTKYDNKILIKVENIWKNIMCFTFIGRKYLLPFVIHLTYYYKKLKKRIKYIIRD